MIKTDRKKRQVTKKMIKVPKREEVIDPKTGQLVDRYTFEIEERDANFHKLWLWHIAAALDLIGNQKIKILSYILTNTNSDNIFIGTMRTIAEATESATKTVNDTVIMLLDADIIKRQQSGVYLINPEVIFKGGTNKRMDILYQYYTEPKKPGRPKKT